MAVRERRCSAPVVVELVVRGGGQRELVHRRQRELRRVPRSRRAGATRGRADDRRRRKDEVGALTGERGRLGVPWGARVPLVAGERHRRADADELAPLAEEGCLAGREGGRPAPIIEAHASGGGQPARRQAVQTVSGVHVQDGRLALSRLCTALADDHVQGHQIGTNHGAQQRLRRLTGWANSCVRRGVDRTVPAQRVRMEARVRGGGR